MVLSYSLTKIRNYTLLTRSRSKSVLDPCYDIIRHEAIPRLVPQAYRRFDLSGGGSPMFPYPSEKGSPRERDPAPRIIFSSRYQYRETIYKLDHMEEA